MWVVGIRIHFLFYLLVRDNESSFRIYYLIVEDRIKKWNTMTDEIWNDAGSLCIKFNCFFFSSVHQWMQI